MNDVKKDFERLEGLNELLDAINMRLDIVFRFRGTCYNISTDGTPFIAECPSGEGKYYRDAEDMVKKHKIFGKPLQDIWEEFEILSM